eukprot:403332252
MSDEDIKKLLSTEAEKIRTLCHGYKNIEVSPLLFHYALDQRIQQSDDLVRTMKITYREILEKFTKTLKAQPQTKGDIAEIRDIYKDGIRPVKKKIQEMWSYLFNNIHIPNQREDVVDWIMNKKLKQETIAEETSFNNSQVKLKRSETERRTAMLLNSNKKRKNFVNEIRLKKSKNSNFIRNAARGGKQIDLEGMKLEKKDLLDDSYRYLGKEIDPYTAQHKKDVNFYRDILLEDAHIKPESRQVISKSQMLRMKEEQFQSKSARILFNKKNFKTATINEYSFKPFDKSKLMKDIDLKDYVPDFRINQMDLKSFKLDKTKTNNGGLSSIEMNEHLRFQDNQLFQSILQGSVDEKSESNSSRSQNSRVQKLINRQARTQRSKYEKDQEYLDEVLNYQEPKDQFDKFQRPKSAASSSKHLSVRRQSNILQNLQNQKRQANFGIDTQNVGLIQTSARKSKQLENFYTQINNNQEIKTPLSTVNLLAEAKKSLERQVKEAKQSKIIQMELNKKRNAAYIPEMRRKDILNQKKKIQSEAIEIGGISKFFIEKEENSSYGSSVSNIDIEIQELREQDEQMNISELTMIKSQNQQTDSSLGKIDREKKVVEIKMFNQSNKIDIKQLKQQSINQEAQNKNEDKVLGLDSKLASVTGEFRKEFEMFKIKSARLPSAIPHSLKRIQFQNIDQENVDLNIQKGLQSASKIKLPSRLISARVGSQKLNKMKASISSNRVQTARDSQGTRGMSATTRPQTAFNSSHKTLIHSNHIKNLKQSQSKRLFSPSINTNRDFQGSPYSMNKQQNYQLNAFDKSHSTFLKNVSHQNQFNTHRPTSPSNNQPLSHRDQILTQLNSLSKTCKQEQSDLKFQQKSIQNTHQKEAKRLDKMQENIEQKFLTVIELGQKKDALKDFRFEKHTFVYGKMTEGGSTGHYLRKDGYDRVEVSDRISKLNGKYAFMAENIKL